MRTVICSDSSLALKSIMSTGSDNYTDGKHMGSMHGGISGEALGMLDNFRRS